MEEYILRMLENHSYNDWICSFSPAAPMKGSKNLSPRRLNKRRAKAKVARQAKKRNRK